MFTSHHQNAGHGQWLKDAASFGNVAGHMYLEDTNESKWIHDEIKHRLKTGNACYLEVGNLLRSRAPSEEKLFKTPVGL
jgi:hypothetical protein